MKSRINSSLNLQKGKIYFLAIVVLFFASCKQIPTVTTEAVTNVTTNSAASGGKVLEDGNAEVTVRGVCWSTNQSPTINDNITMDGAGIGSYTSSITQLAPNNLYYVKAYATNEKGTGYGNAVSFTTNPVIPPTVTTSPVTSKTSNSAVSGGNVTSDGGANVTSRGVCWSTLENPTISSSHTTNGSGTGAFISNITGLSPSASYYVRAYATNSAGTGYGQNEIFTTSSTYPVAGLISYFNFDDNLIDLLGNTPAGVNHGSATFTEGKSGKAITLNGTNQYIQFGRKTYKNVNNISVAFWFIKPNTSESLKYFLSCSDFGVWTKTGTAGIAISLPSTNSASGSITQNTWVHLVGTYDGTNIKVYINSILTEIQYHPGNIYDANSYLTLGLWSSSYWGGSIDDLFIYNKALTQSEVNQLYNYH
ncbi:MAG: hypothetical protein K0B05_01555 [Bacteroidales bacterium]|nr:hypothetical protein [Bacteroidales bacterium]